jgi:AcrR family transcriptional regulator
VRVPTEEIQERQTKGDATRQKILAAAAEQATVRGLAAVSLGDVADAVGLSKSGVFKHFQAKEGLQQALIEVVSQRFVDRVWTPARELPRGRARLEAVFERWLDWVEGEEHAGGCGLLAFAIELDDQPGPLREFLKSQQLLWADTVSRQFAHLREPPVDPLRCRQCAFEMKSLVLGYNHSRRLLDDDSARAGARAAFQGLLDRCAA